MSDVIFAAIPAFIVLMAVEWLALRHARKEAAAEAQLLGYSWPDTGTSLAMGVGSQVIGLGWKIVSLAIFVAFYELSPLRIDMGTWWSWAVLFVATDFLYYCDHRWHHRVRIGWASHVVHHSSERFNLSTALRQTWTPMTQTLFFLPLVLVGFTPASVLLMIAINTLAQFWFHTEKIDKMWAPAEWILNTPSHHRVHHGSQEQYLDKNYAGVFIIWDRMFGTFEPEGERVRYGLTRNIETYNPVRVAFHEWADIRADVRRARGWRAKLGYLLGPPGWQEAAPASGRDVQPAPVAQQQPAPDVAQLGAAGRPSIQ